MLNKVTVRFAWISCLFFKLFGKFAGGGGGLFAPLPPSANDWLTRHGWSVRLVVTHPIRLVGYKSESRIFMESLSAGDYGHCGWMRWECHEILAPLRSDGEWPAICYGV